MIKLKKNSWEVGCNIIVIAPFLLFVLIVVAVGWRDWYAEKESLDWPSTEAAILAHYPPAEEANKRPQAADLDSLTLNYHYKGQYYSRTYRVYPEAQQQRNQLLRLLAQNAEQRLVVRVNPQAPQEIRFEQGISGKTYETLLSGGVLFLLFAWGLSSFRRPSYGAGIQLLPREGAGGLE